jgi:holliday junction DNA helicase RuvB
VPAPKAGAIEKDRLVSAAVVEDDASFELKLRPKFLKEFVGQNKVKENLSVAIEAAKSRGEALDHVLLYGPPGLGKTTLATIIANELGVHFQQTSGPALQIKGDLTAILTNVRARQVLFFDEVHRLQPVLEEILYSALEDYKLDIIIGQGPSARTHTIDVQPFTFVAATTRAGLLSGPLRSRFGLLLRLDFYSQDELRFILERSAEILSVAIDREGANEIAARARGTPRIANRLLRRVRDYAQVRGAGKIDVATAQAALEMLEVDKHGFDEIDRKLLLTIIEKYQGGPVGLNTLAAALAEEADAIEEIYEPFLIQIGFLNRTQRGRVATRLAYEHFGITPSRRQSALF